MRGCSSAGLERLPVTQKVEGSSPFNPANFFKPSLSFERLFFYRILDVYAFGNQ